MELQYMRLEGPLIAITTIATNDETGMHSQHQNNLALEFQNGSM